MNVPARIRRAATAIVLLAGTAVCVGCASRDNPDNTSSPTAATTTGTNPSAKDNAPPSRDSAPGAAPAPAIGDATTQPAEHAGDHKAGAPGSGAGSDRKE